MEYELAIDHHRKNLSENPKNIFLKHKANESIEDYQSEISTTIWNTPNQSIRANKEFKLTVEA